MLLHLAIPVPASAFSHKTCKFLGWWRYRVADVVLPFALLCADLDPGMTQQSGNLFCLPFAEKIDHPVWFRVGIGYYIFQLSIVTVNSARCGLMVNIVITRSFREFGSVAGISASHQPASYPIILSVNRRVLSIKIQLASRIRAGCHLTSGWVS